MDDEVSIAFTVNRKRGQTHREKCAKEFLKVLNKDSLVPRPWDLPKESNLAAVNEIVLPLRLAIYCSASIASSSWPMAMRNLGDSWRVKMKYRQINMPNVSDPLQNVLTSISGLHVKSDVYLQGIERVSPGFVIGIV